MKWVAADINHREKLDLLHQWKLKNEMLQITFITYFWFYFFFNSYFVIRYQNIKTQTSTKFWLCRCYEK